MVVVAGKGEVELREGAEAFDRFEKLVRAVVTVPKREVVREQRKYDAKKKQRRLKRRGKRSA